MRYIVIGAGAVGGTIGGRLSAAGNEVVLVARGAHLDALKARGLRLVTPEGTSTLNIPAVGGPSELELRDGDVLVLAVKTQDAEAVLAEWAWQPVPGGGRRGDTAAAQSLPVVCAQNGVASERFALRRFRQVYGMCVWLPATHLEPGTVEAQGAPLTGLLHVGRYPAGIGVIAKRIGADLAQSRFLAPVVPDVMRWKYGKLLANLANAIEAVCGHDAADDAAGLRRRATAEGAAVLDAAGIGYASGEESAAARGGRIRLLPVNGSVRAGGSSWQSLTRGTGSIEADFLNGEIVLLAREHGLAAPVNEVLQRLANRAARQRRPPGTTTPGEVMALAAVASLASRRSEEERGVMVVVLVGFMGAGKTTVGHIIAERLGQPFVDSDVLIEQRLGRAIRDVFETDGEAYFREVEHVTVADLVRGPEAVIALGGGAVEDPRSRAVLRRAQVVYLRVSYDEALSRVRSDEFRPMLHRPGLDEVYQRRLLVYEDLSVLTVDTDGRRPDAIARDVLSELSRRPASAGR